MIAPPGVAAANFTAVAAGRAGRVAITFVGTGDPNAQDPNRPWNHYTVLSTNALASDPTFLATITNPGGPSDPVHRGACDGPCAGMLDYLSEPSLSPVGPGAVWAAAVDTCLPTSGCSAASGTAAEAGDNQGFVVRQLSGPWLR